MQLSQAISDFLGGYFSTHDRSSKTKSAYSSDLKQFGTFAGMKRTLHSISGKEIENWAAQLRGSGYLPASMRRKIVVLKVFYSYWLRCGEIKESPFWRVKLSLGRIEQLPRALTRSEMKILLAQAGRKVVCIEGSTDNVVGDLENYVAGRQRARRALRNFALLDL